MNFIYLFNKLIYLKNLKAIDIDFTSNNLGENENNFKEFLDIILLLK